jgi:hypothetical protein
MSSAMDGSSRIHGPSDRRYAELPQVLKHLYSPEEYAWLGDMQKQQLERIETEPEWTEP